ncbi:MAG TPA: Crp/Fnr family transcriptional regulator [Fluviicola sp.]|nr:Crp/Fnr family transcriptional regulator [Fluviicola sp.]
MEIDYNILITYGGIAKKVSRGEYIYLEHSHPNYYYQIIQGSVKVFYTNEQGKELIQGMFSAGDCFGEAPLLLDKPYISSSLVMEDSLIVKLKKENFLHLLDDYPDFTQKLLVNFAAKIYEKATLAQILISQTPEEKIIKFLEHLSDKKISEKGKHIPYTRQQIANYTGIRVETVIRTLKKLQKEGKVKIINRKLYY